MAEGSEWLSVAEASAILGVSPRSIRRWISDGQLTGKSTSLENGGRAWLIEKDSLFIERTNERPDEGTQTVNQSDKRTDVTKKVAKRGQTSVNSRTAKRLATQSDNERPNEGTRERPWPNDSAERELIEQLRKENERLAMQNERLTSIVEATNESLQREQQLHAETLLQLKASEAKQFSSMESSEPSTQQSASFESLDSEPVVETEVLRIEARLPPTRQIEEQIEPVIETLPKQPTKKRGDALALIREGLKQLFGGIK